MTSTTSRRRCTGRAETTRDDHPLRPNRIPLPPHRARRHRLRRSQADGVGQGKAQAVPGISGLEESEGAEAMSEEIEISGRTPSLGGTRSSKLESIRDRYRSGLGAL